MLVVQKNKLKVDRGQYHFLRELTHHSKSLYNVYLYEFNLKQHYNYKLLPSDVAQQGKRVIPASAIIWLVRR